MTRIIMWASGVFAFRLADHSTRTIFVPFCFSFNRVKEKKEVLRNVTSTLPKIILLVMLSFLPLPSPHLPAFLEESFMGPARFLPSSCTRRCPSGQTKIAPRQGDRRSCGRFDKLSEKTATCQNAPDSIPPRSPEARLGFAERPPRGPPGRGCAPWGGSGVAERSAPGHVSREPGWRRSR